MRIKKYELIRKSREAMLAAVQIYNNPLITFKSESFIALAVIAWTYLLHAYYGNRGIDCRYFDVLTSGRRKYHRTKHGAFKYWELEKCINDNNCPLDESTKNNLRFLIGIRHEVEHQMTRKIDDSIGAKVQACSINYNYYIKQLFGEKYSVDKDLGFAIQFSPVEIEKKNELHKNEKLAGNIQRFICDFEKNLTPKQIDDIHYAYRVAFVRIDGKRVNQATDEVIRFIPSDSPEAEGLKETIAFITEKEKKKYTSGQIVKMMQEEGYEWFTMGDLTASWKTLKTGRDAYGIKITKYQWMWYENWLPEIRKYCKREDPIRRLDMSPDSLLPDDVVKIIHEHGFRRFNTTWLNYWEQDMKINRRDFMNGHVGKGGKYFWHRNIIPSILSYCENKSDRLKD